MYKKYSKTIYSSSLTVYLSVFPNLSVLHPKSSSYTVHTNASIAHTQRFLQLVNIVCISDFNVSALCASAIPDQLPSSLQPCGVPARAESHLIFSFILSAGFAMDDSPPVWPLATSEAKFTHNSHRSKESAA